ncbi:MAG: class I SAM-dependent methyltransferase [Gemmatimonadaceae bacterium]
MALAVLGRKVAAEILDRRVGNLARRARSLYVDSVVSRSAPAAASIPTHMRRSELAALYDLALNCGPEPAVLEIGSYYGASACYIGAAVSELNGTVTCVDTWANEAMPEGPRDTYSAFAENTRWLGGVIVGVRKRSDEIVPDDLPAALDMAFIDGDHSYRCARTDARIAGPLLREGGILAFHDIKWFQGVARTVGELLATGEWTFDGSVDDLVWLRKSKPNHSEA